MRYAMIDANSGFIWGVEDADNEIDACRAMDEKLGEFGREYIDIGRARLNGATGYVVYRAPEQWDSTDGQDSAQIAEVEAMPLAARVIIKQASDE